MNLVFHAFEVGSEMQARIFINNSTRSRLTNRTILPFECTVFVKKQNNSSIETVHGN